MKESCAGCRFYAPVYEPDLPMGQCRRHAPVVVIEKTPHRRWPDVNADHWCGDFEAKVNTVPETDEEAIWA